ncbi:MAG: glycosyltransferase family 4 protein [Bacteroidaceae bacterium]|nr:glycosyltransferase family 4 protein [Bacteroidaceae bacterium]
MKVAFDAKRVFRNFTGLGNYSRSTLSMLQTYYPDVEQMLFTPDLGKERDRTKAFVPRSVMPGGFLRGSLWRTFQMGNDASRCADIFHGLSNELPYRLSIPSVVTIHDVAFRTFTDMYKPLDRWIYDKKWASACRRADHIIAISHSTKHDVQRFYDVPDDKITVVYQPVDVSFYEPSLGGQGSYILYVGSINSRKNLLSIVQAIEMIPEENRLPLVIVGEGREYKKKVLDYISSHHLEKWCVFKGHVNTLADLQELYRNARMFVYPSHYEGMGLPVIEAQLCGCPVITSDVSSLPEAAGEPAIKLPPTDVHALSQAIDTLTSDDLLWTRLSKEGRQRCMTDFHPKKLAGDLVKVYKNFY